MTTTERNGKKNKRKYKLLEDTLITIRNTEVPSFTALNVGKAMNQTAMTTAGLLRFTRGIKILKFVNGTAVYIFTGEPIIVEEK